jgi:hypothetical protein
MIGYCVEIKLMFLELKIHQQIKNIIKKQINFITDLIFTNW